jgi:hypothetical protein
MKVEEPAGFFFGLLFPSGIAVSQKSVRKKNRMIFTRLFFSLMGSCPCVAFLMLPKNL